MTGIFDSPFVRALATTNSLLLGAGALYLAAFSREKAPSADDIYKHCERLGVKTGYKEERNTREDIEGITAFTKTLKEWNNNLITLEKLLGRQIPEIDVDEEAIGVDEVDAIEVAGHHKSELIFKQLDKSLLDVVGKVNHLRQLLNTRQRGPRKNKKSDVVHSQELTSYDLFLFKNEDSDADSFLSAESDIEDRDCIGATNADQAKERALEIAGIHRDKALYVTGLELYFNQEVKCRKKRSRMVGCANDLEFMAKVHCIREASKVAFADENIQNKFEERAENILAFLIRTAGKDHHECQKRWKALVSFCKTPENWKILERELSQKGVPHITFYDVVLDFVVMDAFVDLENPPYAVQAAVQNTWLPTYIQQTGLETAVWGVLKAKMQMLQEPAGFLMHFYHLSEILTPVLAWGFLGSDDRLSKACKTFKEHLMGYIQDLFNFQLSDYDCVENLANDISRLAEERYDELKPLLAQPYGNGPV